MQERPIKSTKTITDFYSAKEIEEKYQISYSRLYVIAKENNIPSATLSGKRLFSMEHIDRYFRQLGYKEAEEITEWYTIEQIQINPAKRNAIAVKNEMRFSLQKRNVLQKSRLQSFRLSYPVEIQVSFKRLLKTI